MSGSEGRLVKLDIDLEDTSHLALCFQSVNVEHNVIVILIIDSLDIMQPFQLRLLELLAHCI